MSIPLAERPSRLFDYRLCVSFYPGAELSLKASHLWVAGIEIDIVDVALEENPWNRIYGVSDHAP